MTESRKVFYNIAELTEEFRKAIPKIENAATALLWQTRAQFAVAQQLAVISGHLEDLISAIHRSENKQELG